MYSITPWPPLTWDLVELHTHDSMVSWFIWTHLLLKSLCTNTYSKIGHNKPLTKPSNSSPKWVLHFILQKRIYVYNLFDGYVFKSSDLFKNSISTSSFFQYFLGILMQEHRQQSASGGQLSVSAHFEVNFKF